MENTIIENSDGKQPINVTGKNTIVNNISVTKNPFTTIFGGLFIILGIGLIIIPAFMVEKTPIPVWSGWALAGIGILLLFAPDKLIGGLGKLVDKKSQEL